jgi:hypothetical protein
MKNARFLHLAVLAFLLLIVSEWLMARHFDGEGADFDLSWNTIDGGGGTSIGGGPAGFELEGTIGQPDASGPLIGGGFELAGGFWPGASLTPDSCPPDINNSGTVDVDDLIAMILGWGMCANCAVCPPDANGSCSVDADDLIMVILGWGSCP